MFQSDPNTGQLIRQFTASIVHSYQRHAGMYAHPDIWDLATYSSTSKELVKLYEPLCRSSFGQDNVLVCGCGREHMWTNNLLLSPLSEIETCTKHNRNARVIVPGFDVLYFRGE